MSDLERLLAFLNGANVEHTDQPDGPMRCVEFGSDWFVDGRWNGYGGFFAAFKFDAEGKLVEFGCWE